MIPRELVAKMRELRAHRRGRRHVNAYALDHGQLRFVVEVFDREHELGSDRGALAEAVRQVAERHGLTEPETFRKYVHRHRYLRAFAALRRRLPPI